jgi:hypothetical protein
MTIELLLMVQIDYVWEVSDGAIDGGLPVAVVPEEAEEVMPLAVSRQFVTTL